MQQHALRVPDELWERIEDARGRLSRNAYLVSTLDNGVPATQWAGITVQTDERMTTGTVAVLDDPKVGDQFDVVAVEDRPQWVALATVHPSRKRASDE